MASTIQPRKPAPGRSLAELFPEVAAQWDTKKNGGLTPNDISAWTHLKVWWRCPISADHEWLAPASDRVRSPGCPFCRGLRISRTNSVAQLFPSVARQWHRTLNGTLQPEEVVAGSGRHVWWSCPKSNDHEWQATPNDRTWGGHGCPFCTGNRVGADNNLATCNPALARLWNRKRNHPLTPKDVLPGSDKTVWWKCPAGPDHEWRARIEKQRRGTCPFCENRRASITNSLATKRPDIALLWDQEKNGVLTPAKIVAGSTRAVWWRCPKGPDHAWRGYVFDVAQREGCPFCQNWRVSVTNCLATIAPRLARYFHPTRNGRLTARTVTAASGRLVWWSCDQGPDHQWRANIHNAVRARRPCPFCAGRRASVTNSLTGLFPRIAREWNLHRNAGRKPTDVLAASPTYVWWRCPLGHEWRASIRERTTRGRSCPVCADAVLPMRARSSSKR